MHQLRFPRFIALGLVSAIALTTAGYAAADKASPDASSRWHGHQRFQEKLDLTDDQMAAIREVHTRHADQHKQLAQSLRKAEAELREAALSGGDVKAKTAEVTALLGQLTELRATTLQEMSPILTPEQRETMAKMKTNMRGHRHRGPRPTEG
jgi:Spy/CpxP family protein refolding chaperone